MRKSRRTDQMINQNWENIQALMDFRDITSLEKRGDVRSTLVAMARFFKLKVNEKCLTARNSLATYYQVVAVFK